MFFNIAFKFTASKQAHRPPPPAPKFVRIIYGILLTCISALFLHFTFLLFWGDFYTPTFKQNVAFKRVLQQDQNDKKYNLKMWIEKEKNRWTKNNSKLANKNSKLLAVKSQSKKFHFKVSQKKGMKGPVWSP